ncbi:MAG TPA: aminotransferase class I/II-fold pyridoxal phosphate-dependent enzyme, partial [Pyrodictium sp.]|nr:aminotransferase class I/II-fold pyridoxal phosphate-dependent enzyme [Pyrodictium sp.]
DTMELAEKLFEAYGILVNPGECFLLPGTLRIGLGTDPARFPKAARELLEALQSLRGEAASN